MIRNGYRPMAEAIRRARYELAACRVTETEGRFAASGINLVSVGLQHVLEAEDGRFDVEEFRAVTRVQGFPYTQV